MLTSSDGLRLEPKHSISTGEPSLRLLATDLIARREMRESYAQGKGRDPDRACIPAPPLVDSTRLLGKTPRKIGSHGSGSLIVSIAIVVCHHAAHVRIVTGKG